VRDKEGLGGGRGLGGEGGGLCWWWLSAVLLNESNQRQWGLIVFSEADMHINGAGTGLGPGVRCRWTCVFETIP
jgi:hypothetical protein